jgi:hypothetical protein
MAMARYGLIWFWVFVGIVVLVGGIGVALGDERVDPDLVAVLEAHNRERRKEGLGMVKLSAKLNQAAFVHAKDMAAHSAMDHKGSDGSSTVDRVKRTGYVYLRVGENVAEGQQSVAEVMVTWMDSPGHKANILGKFTELGAACVLDDQGVPYWCVDFGTPMPRLDPGEAAAAVLGEWNKSRGEGADERPKKTSDAALGKAAMAICAAMASKDSLKSDVEPSKLIADQGIKNRALRMQFVSGAPTAVEAAKELVQDTGDELNGMTAVGIGYAIAKSGTPYWCAIFAKPEAGRRAAPGRKGGSR